eukprot:TRINITY_DN578_c0_g1_i1.p1 TRINITY_DN578_c0_g1~~TRINITY_DN578_c0_g1_i1.p1  ORF type:complete len:199 (-),score=101.71 TRINITY_DN578_c0_g1_i1:87-683(-)
MERVMYGRQEPLWWWVLVCDCYPEYSDVLFETTKWKILARYKVYHEVADIVGVHEGILGAVEARVARAAEAEAAAKAKAEEEAEAEAKEEAKAGDAVEQIDVELSERHKRHLARVVDELKIFTSESEVSDKLLAEIFCPNIHKSPKDEQEAMYRTLQPIRRSLEDRGLQLTLDLYEEYMEEKKIDESYLPKNEDDDEA